MKRIVSILLFELCCLLWAGTGWSQQFDDSFPVIGPHSEGRHKADAIDLGKPDSTFYFIDARDSREYSNDAGGRARDIYYKFEVERPMDIVIHNFRSKIQATRTHLYKIRELEDYEVPAGEMCPEIACSDDMDWNLVDEVCSHYIEEMPEFRYGGNYKGLLCMRRLEKGTYYVMSEGDESHCIDSEYNGIIVTTIRGFAAEGNHFDYPIFAGIYSQDFDYEDGRDPWYYYSKSENMTSIYYTFSLQHTMDVTISQNWSNPVGTDITLKSDESSFSSYKDTLSLQLFPGNYQIELSCNSFSDSYLRISGRMSDYQEPSENLPVGLTNSRNYIYTIRPTLETSSIAESTSTEATHIVRYFDAFGRPSQVVNKGFSPSQKDMVYLQEYDCQGREGRKWLPVVSASDGGYVEKEKLAAFSRSFYSGDSCAYSYPVYEGSPLNRMKEYYGEGGEWHGKGKSTRTDYRLNTCEDSLLNCLRFRINKLSDTLFILDNYGNYESGTLYVEHKSDEDGNVSCLFTDYAGRMVLQRCLTGENQSSTYCDTYFIYDGNGRLQAVLPPAAVDSMQAVGSYSSASSVYLEQYVYFYRYDYRNRCVAKKLPGSAWEYFIYDDADRLILSQDGNLRRHGEWKFSLPDAIGRVVLTGICRNEVAEISTCLRGIVAEAKYSVGNTDTTFGGYSVRGLVLISPVLHSVSYYDSYAFLGRNGFPSYAYDESKEVEGYGAWYGDSCGVYSHKGLQTGSVSFPLQPHAPALYSVSYYDKYRRCIQVHSSHLLEGCDSEYLSYDFVGNLLKRLHVQTALGKALQSELYTYRYDHVGRLLETRHRLNNGPEISLSECGYDAIGRLVFEKKHANDCLLTEYSYNIRSWTEKIRGPLFSQTLCYTDGAGTPCYNGNISSMTWETNSFPVRGYKFTYDGLSRITDAVYGEGNTLVQHPNHFNEQVTGYDKMGNILGLLRYGQTESGSYGLIDNLNFSYDGNQLRSVYDNATLPASTTRMEFVDRADLFVEYTYDTNGNLTKDLNKKIVDIQYNVLNLPSKVTFGDGNSVSYMHTADGRKLQTVHTINGTTTTTDYVGNMIYENGALKRTLVDGGYYENNEYYFYIQDHLGNNRVVAKQDGTVVQMNDYYPFGMEFASNTNGTVQPYKYNGKELDTKGGLNLYDYGARHYDPVLGRFMTVDPMAEQYYSWSPYAYCLNNPMKYIDPNGKASQYPPGGGTRVHMGFTNWSPEKTARVGAIAQSTNASGKQAFAGSRVTLSGSVKTVGGGFSLGSVGTKAEVGIGNLSVSTGGTELTTTTSLFKGEYSATVGSAALKTEATLGEVEGVIGGANEGIGTTAFSASSKVQVGDNTNAGLDIGGNISAGVKAGPVEANFSVNLRTAGEWISGALQTIAKMFSPEIIIRVEDQR